MESKMPMQINGLDQSTLNEIEYIFSQSVKGIHLLFDNKKVADILKNPTEDIEFFTVENINKIQTLLTDLIAQNTIDEKLAFLDSLTSETFELLVRTYFNIIENTILESTPHMH